MKGFRIRIPLRNWQSLAPIGERAKMKTRTLVACGNFRK